MLVTLPDASLVGAHKLDDETIMERNVLYPWDGPLNMGSSILVAMWKDRLKTATNEREGYAVLRM